MKYLVIVESPAKKKPIEKYLGKDYEVRASFGHIRDLPSKNGSVLPDEDFAMKYEISDKSKKHVSEIAKAAKSAEIVYLATDPDREGESIAWHIAQVLKHEGIAKTDDFFQRIAFNEITKKAVTYAINNPRKIDENLVNAQQARRALDYLVGFNLSPLLWRKLPGCKSAGRVQSVALRAICEREDEIERFKTEEYWDITLGFINKNQDHFTAKLTHVRGTKLEKFTLTNESQAGDLVKDLENKDFTVTEIEKKQQRRNPPPPFITSSMQQEAARKLGFSAKKTMQIAQKLYEGLDIDGETVGLITYMRTDGTTLSGDAVDEIRALIEKDYGDKYLPNAPRIYKSKVKNAQEAHEAIRPTDITLKPDALKNSLEKDFYKLYDLIWKRTMACQMENVIMDVVVATFNTSNNDFTARATGTTIAFDGFYKIYREDMDDEKEEESKLLPPLNKGEEVTTEYVKPLQHFTEPPPRYSEASLVKKLEELGIGRPSTYASILSVLQERNYVRIDKKRFIPEELGRLLTVFLVGYFKKYVEYDFTASLETELDEVAEGKLGWKKLMEQFWTGFNSNITQVADHKITDVITYVEKELDFHLFGEDEKTKDCTACNKGKLSLKLGKFGAFLGCSNYPECNFKKPITSGSSPHDEGGEGAAQENDKLIGEYQSQNVFLKKGPYGWYLQLGEQISKLEKPKRVPLPPTVLPTAVDLDTATKLLSLPLNIGKHPDSGEDILMGIGKFGPYLKYMAKFTSIPKKLNPFEVTLEEAVEIIAQGKTKEKKGK